jgi:hypothetical protein
MFISRSELNETDKGLDQIYPFLVQRAAGIQKVTIITYFYRQEKAH